MSLRLCPDCDNRHRGRCVVCRPCAHKRLVEHAGAHLFFVSRETVPVEARNAQVLQDNRAKDEWRDIIGETDSIDPHATDLALAVAEDMQRGRG